MRSVLLRLEHALNSFEWMEQGDVGQDVGQEAVQQRKKKRAPATVEGKVASLFSLVLSQREQIQQLRNELASCHQPLPCGGPSIVHGMVESAHTRPASLVVQHHRLHHNTGVHEVLSHGQEDECATPFDPVLGILSSGPSSSSDHQPAYYACTDYHSSLHAGAVQWDKKGFVGGVYAHGVIEYWRLQAHLLIDVCEEMLVRSMTAALEMLDEALRCLCLAPVCYSVRLAPLPSGAQDLEMHYSAAALASSCAAPSSCAPPAVPHASYSCVCCLSSQCDWWWWSGDNLYNAYC